VENYQKIIIVESATNSRNKMIFWQSDNNSYWKLEFLKDGHLSIFSKIKKLLQHKMYITLTHEQILNMLVALLPLAQNVAHHHNSYKIKNLEISRQLSYVVFFFRKKELYLNQNQFDELVSTLTNLV